MLTAALAVLVHATGAQAADTVKLSSRYRFSGGQRERLAIGEAIEDVLAAMTFIVRPIARKRLKAATRVPERVKIHIDDDAITIELGDQVYKTPADGRPMTVIGSDGEEVELRMRVIENALEQSFNKVDGGKDNTFRRVGARKMRLAVRIHSEKLPKDLKYALTYTRT
jgi:hypothetical protein